MARNTPSAVGDRQIFPVHTNKTLTTGRFSPANETMLNHIRNWGARRTVVARMMKLSWILSPAPGNEQNSGTLPSLS
jgi:hypothetical protein